MAKVTLSERKTKFICIFPLSPPGSAAYMYNARIEMKENRARFCGLTRRLYHFYK